MSNKKSSQDPFAHLSDEDLGITTDGDGEEDIEVFEGEKDSSLEKKSPKEGSLSERGEDELDESFSGNADDEETEE